jgi:hypothetical protein
MHARHQLDQAQYQAARAYQALSDRTAFGTLRSGRLEPRVDCVLRPDPLLEGRATAAKRLRSVEGTLRDYYGAAGLSLTRSVLTDRKSVETAAREHGARTARETKSWCWLFRKCLDVLAKALGFASSTRRPTPVARGDKLPPGEGIPDTRDVSMHANASDLADEGLRRGRPNGGG